MRLKFCPDVEGLTIERRPSNSCQISVLLRDVNKDNRNFAEAGFFNANELKP